MLRRCSLEGRRHALAAALANFDVRKGKDVVFISFPYLRKLRELPLDVEDDSIILCFFLYREY